MEEIIALLENLWIDKEKDREISREIRLLYFMCFDDIFRG